MNEIDLHDRLRLVENENKVLTRFVLDGAAFIRHVREWGVSKDLALTTLLHDFTGLSKKGQWFVPRVSGYHKDDKVSGYK